jgi:cytochrome c oxidase assembly protein subunit 15
LIKWFKHLLQSSKKNSSKLATHLIALYLCAIMGNSVSKKKSNAVAIWLLTGVGMIIIQVLLGGITRLTGSGLSITEWKPILGALPPLNEEAWLIAFEQYKQIGQFKHINFDFTLSDFKFIYFWEWFHREWARLIAVVFMVPFIWFIVKRKFKKEMINPLIILFLLGGLQGLIGWIMVKSGLNQENLYVNHIRLAIHFISALGLLCYTCWFAMMLLVPAEEKVISPSLKNFTIWLLVLIVIQLVFGAFMAGLKAANFATTWPLINGEFMPSSMSNDSLSTFTHDPLAVHFIHRNLAYIITLLIVIWYFKAKKITAGAMFSRLKTLPLALVLIQVILGIFTVLYANDKTALLWLGVAHQFTAMILVLVMVWLVYLVRSKTTATQH